jgi:hypothetical protein
MSWLEKRFEWIDTQLQVEAEGIEDLPASKETATKTIYDLSGRKVTDRHTQQKGIYIINGKKTVIR